jgi:tripartite-type tricarboxylate transporter receptor subunit TctC
VRRIWNALTAAFVIAALTGVTARAEYPDRPIRLVVGFAAGGGADILVRYFGEKLAALSGATVVVENKPGAAGNLATDAVAKARPDGYTILLTASSTLAGNVHIYKSLPFEPIKDLTPITTLAELGFVIAVNPELTPVKDVKELGELLKGKGGKVTYGVATTTAQACAELFRAAAGFEGTSVSYKASAQALSDVAAGQINFACADSLFALGQEKAGKVKLLAVTTTHRLSALSHVPTFQEGGFASVVVAPWWAAYVPAKTPPDVARKLAGWLDQIVASPETKEFLARQATEPLIGSAALAQEKLAADLKAWAEIVKIAKIEPQ